jgi:hypothetical protein
MSREEEMLDRRLAMLLLLVAACDAKPQLTEEEALRQKYGDSKCFITARDLPPSARPWHSRTDCPDLVARSGPSAPLLVRPQRTGLLDAKGVTYNVEHCPRCVH